MSRAFSTPSQSVTTYVLELVVLLEHVGDGLAARRQVRVHDVQVLRVADEVVRERDDLQAPVVREVLHEVRALEVVDVRRREPELAQLAVGRPEVVAERRRGVVHVVAAEVERREPRQLAHGLEQGRQRVVREPVVPQEQRVHRRQARDDLAQRDEDRVADARAVQVQRARRVEAPPQQHGQRQRAVARALLQHGAQVLLPGREGALAHERLVDAVVRRLVVLFFFFLLPLLVLLPFLLLALHDRLRRRRRLGRLGDLGQGHEELLLADELEPREVALARARADEALLLLVLGDLHGLGHGVGDVVRLGALVAAELVAADALAHVRRRRRPRLPLAAEGALGALLGEVGRRVGVVLLDGGHVRLVVEVQGGRDRERRLVLREHLPQVDVARHVQDLLARLLVLLRLADLEPGRPRRRRRPRAPLGELAAPGRRGLARRQKVVEREVPGELLQ
jgi:hypothetical protein